MHPGRLPLDRLRSLDDATGGAFYVTLARCRDAGLAPSLSASPGEAGGWELMLVGKTDELATKLLERWSVPAEHTEAGRIVARIHLTDLCVLMRVTLAQIDAGRASLRRRREGSPAPRTIDPVRRRS